jgi:FkbH-like protein
MENLKYTEILQLNKALAGTVIGKPYKVGILSNVTVNSFKEILEYNCRLNNVEPVIEIGNFDNIVQDSAVSGHQDMIVICYDALSIVDDLNILFDDIDEQAYNNLLQKLCSEIDIILNNLRKVPSVIFNTFSAAYFPPNYTGSTRIDHFVATLNKYLDERKTDNLTIVDLDKIFAQIGIKQAVDFRFYYSSKAPYTVAFWKEYALAVQPVILRNNGKLKKAVIFDCDNTLWKGIIGEDGLEHIDFSPHSKYGKFYASVQQLAVFLSKKGVIIGLCSKNNPQDVEEVLQHKDMQLKNDHIVIKKVNWTDKASNLKAIAEELNIGIDSLVFVDDSPFEINLIKEQVPEVLTLQVPANVADYPSQLFKLVYRYFNLNTGKEDAQKAAMYKAQFEREESKNAYASIDDYLASLGITLSVARNNPDYIPRVAQLTQKTNQFNLTTQRYTESQVRDFMLQGHDSIFTIFVSDKFGDSGLTGVAIVVQDAQHPETAIIDSLLMSCRIIGRNIEYVFLNHIIQDIKARGYKKIKASYVPTKKNAQVLSFYESRGFELLTTNTDGVKEYQLDIASFTPETYAYITLNEEPLLNSN